ncbi:MAG: DUF6471 domain-containing protein [Bacteroidota bacterium]
MADTWNKYAKRLIKSEMLKRGISSDDLVILLDRIGIEETKSSINSKISRGTFSASFLFQVLSVIGCKSIDLLSPAELNFKSEIKNQVRLNLK